MSFDLAKHGLNLKKRFKTNLSHFWRTKNGNEERRRGEEEKEEERKKRRGRASKAKLQKGMEPLTLSMELLTWYGSLVLLVNGLPQT